MILFFMHSKLLKLQRFRVFRYLPQTTENIDTDKVLSQQSQSLGERNASLKLRELVALSNIKFSIYIKKILNLHLKILNLFLRMVRF